MTSDRPAPPPHSAAPHGPRTGVPLAEAAGWALGFALTIGAAAVAAVSSIVLTVFGFGGIALVLAASLALIAATRWRRGVRPLAVVGLALTLPATWASVTEARLDPSRGALYATPQNPGDVAAHRGTYRRGIGPVLLDLRDFRAPAGSTTRLRARADAGRLVVALPEDRCLALDVRFGMAEIRRPAAITLRVVRAVTGEREPAEVVLSSMGLTRAAAERTSRVSGRAALSAWNAGSVTSPYGLLAFNVWAAEAGRYDRPADGRPNAPTLQLDLRSSQQIVIRDYPRDVDPLALTFSNTTDLPVGGMAWPEGLPVPVPPSAAGRPGRSSVRSVRNRAAWIAWEGRMITWAKAQAERSAGPCASREAIADRGSTFLTQPEAVRRNGRVDRLLGPRSHYRSTIRQRPVDADDTMLLVEVDGLGRTRVLGEVRHRGNELGRQVTP